MSIVKKEVGEDGTLWGWENREGKWVELDPAAEQGSTLGNLGRAAVRGFRDVGQGIRELQTLPDNPIHPELLTAQQQQLANQGQLLEAQQQAASQSAPIAEAIGGSAPEVLAGVGAGLATGGMGLLPAIAGQAGAGAFTGFLRPGDAQERAANAALGGVLGVLGEVALPVAQSAFRGMRAGLNMGEAITGRAAARAGNELDIGLSRAEQAAASASRGEAGSVGAAATPEGEIPEAIRTESDILQRGEDVGSQIDVASEAASREQAEAHGYRSPFGAGTREGSPERMYASVEQMTPLGDIREQGIKASNQRLLSTQVAETIGLPNPKAATSLQPQMIADAENANTTLFQQVEANLPAIGASDFARTMEGISQKKGPAGRSMGQKIVNDAIEEAKQVGGVYDGEQMMQTRQLFAKDMANFYEKNDPSSAQVMRQAIDKLDDLIEKLARKSGSDELMDKWARARTQWQVQEMVKKPGVISPTGDINTVALMRQMRREKRNGGFGWDGPPRGTPARKLWEIARVHAADQTQVPMTGVRGVIASQMGKNVQKMVGAGALGGLGLSGAGSLFD